MERQSWLAEMQIQFNQMTERVISHLRESRLIYWLLFICLQLCLYGCVGIKQREVDEAAIQIFESLYVPEGTDLLRKFQSSDIVAYGKGCTGTMIEVAYGTNRSMPEILNDYGQHLIDFGWEVSPYYKQDLGAHFYDKGDTIQLHILPNPVSPSLKTPDPSEEQYETVFSIMILHTIPSVEGCSG